mmetsp:Transcript_267/g.658  ORF Transcript_267/g.658 Transcript_267/m.658 type:complete len:258 (-) Transcript_267:1693-2466(-)
MAEPSRVVLASSPVEEADDRGVLAASSPLERRRQRFVVVASLSSLALAGLGRGVGLRGALGPGRRSRGYDDAEVSRQSKPGDLRGPEDSGEDVGGREGQLRERLLALLRRQVGEGADLGAEEDAERRGDERRGRGVRGDRHHARLDGGPVHEVRQTERLQGLQTEERRRAAGGRPPHRLGPEQREAGGPLSDSGVPRGEGRDPARRRDLRDQRKAHQGPHQRGDGLGHPSGQARDERHGEAREEVRPDPGGAGEARV